MGNFYSIGDAAKATGVSPKQLRHWEFKGYIDPPARNTCGARSYRVYSEDQISVIRDIKGFLDQGYELSFAVHYAWNNRVEVKK